MSGSDAGKAEAGQAVIEAARTVVLNAYGTKPRHTRARDGGCRDDCIPCGIDRLREALARLDETDTPAASLLAAEEGIMTETAPALVRVRLVPVEVFGADEEDCSSCGGTIRFGYGLMDAVSAWSDCNRARGRIYRKDDDYSEGYREPGDVITVYVPQSELAKFERRYGDAMEGDYDRCPACKVPYSKLPARHKLKRPECETVLPHDPAWNLLPMGGGRSWSKPPWKCKWHGWVEDEKCGECKREHAEYRATGNWTPKPGMKAGPANAA